MINYTDRVNIWQRQAVDVDGQIEYQYVKVYESYPCKFSLLDAQGLHAWTGQDGSPDAKANLHLANTLGYNIPPDESLDGDWYFEMVSPSLSWMQTNTPGQEPTLTIINKKATRSHTTYLCEIG